MKSRVWASAALVAWLSGLAPVGMAQPAIDDAVPVVMSILVYVKPDRHEAYQRWYEKQQNEHRLPGVVYSYLVAPAEPTAASPFTSVTIWKSMTVYKDYMKHIKGDRPAAALEDKRSAEQMLASPPEYTLSRPIAYSR